MTYWLFWILALPSAVAWLFMAGLFAYVGRTGRKLTDVDLDPNQTLPSLSVVVPALNEEATIEPAMRSLLALDYPGLEVVAVDDRSTDATGVILDRLAAQNPHLRVRHVESLPPGWLGKNHALYAGSKIVSGEWILFTDADVHFTAAALRISVACPVGDKLEHIVILT